MTSEKELLASFIANFKKGTKIDDPIRYAETCKALIDLYGSPEKVAEKLGIGKETVRILSKIVELPSYVKSLISERKIPLTVAFDVVPVDRARQVEAANAVIGLRHRDARKVIRRFSENPHKSAETVRSEVLSELEKKELNIAMIALPRNIFKKLRDESRDVPDLVKLIVNDWLKRDYALDTSFSFKEHDLVSLTVKLSRQMSMALRRKTQNPANLIEQIIITWLKRQGRISQKKTEL
jgi:hypothetical protein